MFGLGLGLGLGACGGGGSPGAVDGPPGGGSGDGGGGHADSGGSDGFVELVGRDWAMGQGQQGYKCIRVAVAQDMWVDGFRANSPQGTHHEVLTISDNSHQVGEYDCDAGSLDSKMLYAAGVNTDDLVFPPGVAIHVTAGQFVNLNLHLFDLTDAALSGHSGVSVHTIAQANVVNEADMEFSGTALINIPSDNQPHVATGGCQAPADWHLFTLWPHMHQTATHQKLTVTHGGTTTALLDTDYAFTEQRNYPITNTLVHQGDQITTTCTYVNDTGSTKTFGESSTSEMCFTGMYKYPADGNTFGCVTGGGF